MTEADENSDLRRLLKEERQARREAEELLARLTQAVLTPPLATELVTRSHAAVLELLNVEVLPALQRVGLWPEVPGVPQ